MEIPTAPETTGGANGAPDATADKLAAAGNRVAAKHEPAEKRGPGRPRNDGRPPGSGGKDRPRAAGAGGEQAQPAPPPAVDRRFIEDAAKQGLRIIDGIVVRRVHGSIMRLHEGLKGEAEAMADLVALKPEEIELVSKTVGTIAEKYPNLFGYAPEITLGLFVLGYGARVLSATSEIKKLAEFVAEHRPAAVPPMSPDANKSPSN